MSCTNIIAHEIKPLIVDMTIAEAMDYLDDHNLEHLPLVDQDQYYLGMLSYEMVAESSHTTLQELYNSAQLFKGAVNEKALPYRAAKIIYENKLDTLAIVDDKDILVGITNKSLLLDYMILDTGIMQSGGIVILIVKTFNYSLSEIARICETNEVLILNLQIKSVPEQDEMHIILKTNSKNLDPIEAAFQRYEYNVTVIDGEHNSYSLVQERYDLLMNYLKL